MVPFFRENKNGKAVLMKDFQYFFGGKSSKPWEKKRVPLIGLLAEHAKKGFG